MEQIKDKVSVTVPNEAYSVRDILQKFSTGMDLRGVLMRQTSDGLSETDFDAPSLHNFGADDPLTGRSELRDLVDDRVDHLKGKASTARQRIDEIRNKREEEQFNARMNKRDADNKNRAKDKGRATNKPGNEASEERSDD